MRKKKDQELKKSQPSGDDDPSTGDRRRYFLLAASPEGLRNVFLVSELSCGGDDDFESILPSLQPLTQSNYNAYNLNESNNQTNEKKLNAQIPKQIESRT